MKQQGENVSATSYEAGMKWNGLACEHLFFYTMAVYIQ